MPSPKKSPSKSPKKANSPSPNKGAKGGDSNETDEQLFRRKRYDLMGTVFTQKSPLISIYVRSIHIYEVWNRIPPIQQFCNSNVNDNASKQSPKASPKKSPNKNVAKSNDEETVNIPELLPAILMGLVVVRKDQLLGENQLFIEATANFQYFGYSKVPPYVEGVGSRCPCYREFTKLYPINFDKIQISNEFIGQLTRKIKLSQGKGYKCFPFFFDLTQKPDSVFFNRPYYYEFKSGLFWNLRAYLAKEENCVPTPERTISMEFFKYTISPVLKPLSLRETPPMAYIRYATLGDTGDLTLQVQLDRDVYYHFQDVRVKIDIENGSTRHVVHEIVTFVEQTYRLYHQFPYDCSTVIAETTLKAGEQGIPINPKGRWSKEITVKPIFDQLKYNLAIDGKMEVDNKVFLASSTIIVLNTLVPEKAVDNSTKSNDQSPKNSPKASPKGGKQSPKSKSPEKKSPNKSKNAKETKEDQAPPNTLQKESQPGTIFKEVKEMTNKQSCRSIYISYDVVVRLNLKTTDGDESGHPMVRVPFILTRESRFLDLLANPPPPTWSVIKPH